MNKNITLIYGDCSSPEFIQNIIKQGGLMNSLKD